MAALECALVDGPEAAGQVQGGDSGAALKGALPWAGVNARGGAAV